MLHSDASQWSPFVWALHVLAVVYLVGFFVSWVRLRAWRNRVAAGGTAECEAFNRAVRRFPLSFYAKMLGVHPVHRGSGTDAEGPSRGP